MKPFLLTSLLAGLILILASVPTSHPVQAFHSEQELEALHTLMLFGPVDSMTLFPTSSHCSGCHGYDSLQYAMVDFFGNDVNIHDDWQATMMANAAKDPFWRAKVSHEVALIPNHAEAIEGTCTSCHAPMGHYMAFFRGHDAYTMDDLLQDTIGLDGVSCSACHMISAEDLGNLHSGEIRYDTNRVMYGPFEEPFSAPMTNFVGFDPVYSPHVADAGMCASCHTLLTEAITLDGQLTGETFVEQATYHEWLNSAYAEDQQNVTCQSCHMPSLEEEVVVSSNYLFLDGRSPYALHEFAGANTFMLEMLKTYREELEIEALPEHFDETIAATYRLLQFESVDTELEWLGMDLDTAVFRLQLTNKAGHKLPSGYPSRRMFVEFLVQTELGDTLFHSGAFNEQNELVHEDATYEPHYDIIRSPEQVQIYEMVAGDGTNDFTVVLEHARYTNKDNRLPPQGFSSSHTVADTTLIVGAAASDENFNWDDLGEGTGGDELYFHIFTQNYAGPVVVSAKVYYHALPPKWVNPIFETSTPEIDYFEQLYHSIENIPVLMDAKQLTEVQFPEVNAVENLSLPSITVYPNPNNNGQVFFRLPADLQIKAVSIYGTNGQFLTRVSGPLQSLQLPGKGLFLLQIESNEGSWVEKVVRW